SHPELLAVRSLLEHVDLVQVTKVVGARGNTDLVPGVLGERPRERVRSRIAAVRIEAAILERELVGPLETMGGEVESGFRRERARGGHEQSGEQGCQEDGASHESMNRAATQKLRESSFP